VAAVVGVRTGLRSEASFRAALSDSQKLAARDEPDFDSISVLESERWLAALVGASCGGTAFSCTRYVRWGAVAARPLGRCSACSVVAPVRPVRGARACQLQRDVNAESMVVALARQFTPVEWYCVVIADRDSCPPSRGVLFRGVLTRAFWGEEPSWR